MKILQPPLFTIGQKVMVDCSHRSARAIPYIDPDDNKVLTIDGIGYVYSTYEYFGDDFFQRDLLPCPGDTEGEILYCLGQLTDDEMQLVKAFRALSEEAQSAFVYIVQRMSELEGIRCIVNKTPTLKA